MSFLKQWLDSGEWEQKFPKFETLDTFEKEEIKLAMMQSGQTLILRNWHETRSLFLNYLLKSPHSPFKQVDAIFARDEYQAEVGNLPHIHLMLSISWDMLT